MNLHPNLGSTSFDTSSKGFVAVLIVKLVIFFVFFLPVQHLKLPQKLQQRWLIKFLAQGNSFLHPLWASSWENAPPTDSHHFLSQISHTFGCALGARLGFIKHRFTFKNWSGHGHFSDKVYFSIQVLICALGNVWGWGNPVWHNEAVATNHLLLLFPLSNHALNVPNSQILKYSWSLACLIFLILGLSGIRNSQMALAVRSQPEHQSSIFGTFYNIFYKNIRTSLNVFICDIFFR